MKELLVTITSGSDRITEETDRALFKSHMRSVQSRFESATQLLTEMRGMEIEGTEQVKDVLMPTEIRKSMDNTSRHGLSANELGNDETTEKHEPLPMNTNFTQRNEATNISTRVIEIDESNQHYKTSLRNTKIHHQNDESSFRAQGWNIFRLRSIWWKQTKTNKNKIGVYAKRKQESTQKGMSIVIKIIFGVVLRKKTHKKGNSMKKNEQYERQKKMKKNKMLKRKVQERITNYQQT